LASVESVMAAQPLVEELEELVVLELVVPELVAPEVVVLALVVLELLTPEVVDVTEEAVVEAAAPLLVAPTVVLAAELGHWAGMHWRICVLPMPRLLNVGRHSEVAGQFCPRLQSIAQNEFTPLGSY
jgi:hypothetical protein